MSEGGAFEILIDRKGRYSRKWLQQNNDKARMLYRFAKSQGIVPKCMCKKGGIDMQIAHMESNDNYVLKRNPRSGQSHHESCWSHGAPQNKRRGVTDYIHAITRFDDGSSDLNLNTSILFAQNSITPKLTNSTPRSGTRNTKPSASLKGLFEFLWDEANLSSWEPDSPKPNYKSIRALLVNEVASLLSCNKISLNDILIVPYFEQKSAFREIIQTATLCTEDGEPKRRSIILGLVGSYKPTKNENGCVKLYSVNHSIIFINKPTVVARVEKKLPVDEKQEHNYDRERDNLYWFIGTVYHVLNQKGNRMNLVADDATIVAVSKEHVPL